MKTMKKRGQLTIFIILAILIIGIVFFSIFLIKNAQKKTIETKHKVSEPSANFQPVKDYVETCLNKIGKEAFIKLGEHGGYIEPEKFGLAVPNDDFQVYFKSFNFMPGSKQTIPYWFYLEGNPDDCSKGCRFGSERPPLYKEQGEKSIQSQVDEYIDSHIEECLGKFESFTEKGYNIKNLGAPKADTIIGEGKVRIFLEYPLEAMKDETTEKIETYETTLDLNFKKIYDTASTLLETLTANETKYLERLTVESIAGYSLGKDSELPPIGGGTEFELSNMRFWTITEVEQVLKDLISQQTGIIKVMGSANDFFPYTESRTFNAMVSNSMVSYALKSEDATEDISSIDFDFVYLPLWQMYAHVTPGSGGFIGPEMAINMFIIPITLMRYDFVYDVSYPLDIVMNDVSAFNGQGYKFQYGLEVNVRNNKPLEPGFISYKATPSTRRLFCDYQNRGSGDIKIKTQDGITKAPVDDVAVSYSCVDNTCMIGTTKENNGEAMLESKLPTCVGGTLGSLKKGYFGIPVKFNAESEKDGEATINLYKEKTLNARIKKKPVALMEYASCGENRNGDSWQFLPQQTRGLEKRDSAIILLTRKKVGEEQEYIKFLNFNGSTPLVQDIELVPGNYSVEGFVFENRKQDLIIPARQECPSSGPFGGTCYDIPEINMNKTIFLGSTELKNFEITPEELYGAENITFYIPAVDSSNIACVEDLEALNKATEAGKTNAVKPKIE